MEPGKLMDTSGGSAYSSSNIKYTVDVSCRVPEGRHFEGANMVGAFGAQLGQYVKLARADA